MLPQASKEGEFMTKFYLVNYCAECGAAPEDFKNAEAELEGKLAKNFPNPKRLSIPNTWLVSGKDVTSGEIWLEAYTPGLNLNVMKVSEDRAANLR